MNGPGATLQDARHARGLALEDVERDTHIARHYLGALEQEDREALPALVYARGFLSSYAKYLGLNPNELLYRFFPPQSASAPFGSARRLPLVRATTPRPGRIGWIVASVFAAAVVAAFLFAISSVFDDDVAGRAGATVASVDRDGGSNLSAGRTLPLEASGASDRPRTIDALPIEPAAAGAMPDFRGRQVESVLAVLKGLGVPYLIVETYSDRADAGHVLQQTPKPDAAIGGKTAVTLVVSKGSLTGDSP